MDKERAIYFAGLMEEYLNIPSCICENIENELINENYYKVINYVINRRKELENKVNYEAYQEFADIVVQLQQQNKKYKEVIDRAIEYIENNATSNYFDKEKNMFRREEDLLEILKEVE